MHYTAGPVSILAFVSAADLRQGKIFLSGAWLLLNVVGGLVAVYFAVILLLLAISVVLRRRTPPTRVS